ncbi:MAG TPA: hypothetical protein VF451_06470 [Acidobacteriota bacterium]
MENSAGCGGRIPRLLLLLLLPAMLSLLLHVEKNRRGQELRQAGNKFATLVGARPIDKIKAERTRFYEFQYYQGYPLSASYAIADLIRRCDGMAPPLRLLGVSVSAGLQDFKFKLSVGVAAAGPEAARQKFAFFFQELRDLPGVTQASYSGAGGPGRPDGLHVFLISGQAEWQ